MATVDIPQPVNYSAMLGNIPMAQAEIANSQNQLNIGTQAVQQAPQIGANVQATQAETESRMLANYFMQMKMQMAQGVINAGVQNAQPSAAPAPGDQNTIPAAAPAAGGAASVPSSAQGLASTQPPSNTDDGSADPQTLSDIVDPVHLDARAAQLGQQGLTQTPAETRQYNMALQADPYTGMNQAPAVLAASQNRIAQQKIKNQQAMNLSYQKAVAITQSEHPFASLDLAYPAIAEQIDRLAAKNNWTAAQKDQAAVTFANGWAAATHQYSGRPVATNSQNGQTYDVQSGQPLPGAVVPGPGANSMMMAYGRSAAAGLQTVEVPAPGGQGRMITMPLWQYMQRFDPSIHSFEDFKTAQLGLGTIDAYLNKGNARVAGGGTISSLYGPPSGWGTAPYGGAAPAPAAGGAAAPAPQSAAPAAAAAPAPQQPAAPTVRPPHPNIVGGAAAAAAGTPGNPQLRDALAAIPGSQFALNLGGTEPLGTGQSTGEKEQQQAYYDEKGPLNEALEEESNNTNAAAQSQTYIAAAQQVLSSPDYATWQRMTHGVLSSVAQSLGITQGNWASKQQELAKYLGNLSLQNLKGTFDSSRVTQQEVQLAMTELNPSSKMTPQAINELLGVLNKQAQYAIDKAHTLGAYIQAGGDVRQYDQWYQAYSPRAFTVIGNQPLPPSQVTPGGAQAPRAAANEMPNAAANRGRIIVNKQTGQRLVSDGNSWNPLTAATGATGRF